jgi:hypothetical protein
VSTARPSTRAVICDSPVPFRWTSRNSSCLSYRPNSPLVYLVGTASPDPRAEAAHVNVSKATVRTEAPTKR